MGIVVSTSGEKKAPPYMERLQKEHCRKREPTPAALTHRTVRIYIVVHNEFFSWFDDIFSF